MYLFQCDVRDSDGLAAAASATRAVAFDDRSFKASAAWRPIKDPRYFASTALVSTKRGATLTFHDLFVGGSFYLVATTCPTCGALSARIDLHGWSVTRRIDLHARTRADRALLPVIWDDEYEGEGELADITLTITSSGDVVIVDGIG